MFPDKITVVIPTAVRPERRDALIRAIASASLDAASLHEIIVVANGPHAIGADVEFIRRLPFVRMVTIRTGHYPLARRIGYELVRSQYFCSLDDDDELLAGALDARLDYMCANPTVDVLVSNGFDGQSSDGQIDDALLAHAARDPLGALLRGNWLANCGGTFRASTVSNDVFGPTFRHYEWTFTAIKLALQYRIGFVTERHFRYHDSPGSLSKTAEYLLAESTVWERAEALTRRTADWHRVRRRLGAAYHSAADLLMASGELRAAWVAHLKSLGLPGGLRYATFTRHLFWPPST